MAARNTIEEQQASLATAEAHLDAVRTQLTAAEQAHATALADAEAAQQAHAAVQAQLQALLAHPGAQGEAAAEVVLPEVPRPTGTGWSIREAMDLSQQDYAEIQVSMRLYGMNISEAYHESSSTQRTVRSLVIRAQLDWTEDFRRQDPEKLATFFRAVSHTSCIPFNHITYLILLRLARLIPS